MKLSAAELAEAVDGPLPTFAPGKGRLSDLFDWSADENRLCVVAKDPAMKPSATDVGFAHALGHLGDRDLIVVFPEAGAKAVSHRLPFLEVPVRCYALTDTGVARVQPVRPTDVIASYAGVRGGAHGVNDGLELVAPLLAWLAETSGLVPDDRKSYLSWHYKGRQVLTVRMFGASSVELIAGVNYSDPRPGLEPVVLRLDATLTAEQLQQVQSAIALARKRRDSGEDAANQEHLLQEYLRAEWKSLGLQRPPLREVPVRRPVGYGYIDLVGAGTDGRIRVIETKLGPFDRLVLQGLDYWIWARANTEALAEWLELPADAGIDIEYVVAEKTPGHGLIGAYTSGQAEAIQGAIRWRFTTIRNWAGSEKPTIERLPLRTLPAGARGRAAPRKAPARWAVRLGRHLADQASAAGVTLGGGVFWPNASDGLEPAAALIHEYLVTEGLGHNMIGHVRSSQAFALNLFAPLDEQARVKIVRTLGVDAVTVSAPQFEWADPEDLLGERTHASPHATQVDVRFDCVSSTGTRVVCLIEVKLSEPDLNPCSAWLSSKNDRLAVCATSGPFGSDPHVCFQLRNHDREHRRRYDTFLGGLPADVGGHDVGCWFRFGGNQAMRNVALAASLVQRGTADTAVVALCAPKGHRSMWRRWTEAKDRLHVPDVALFDLPAEAVVIHHADSQPLCDRYLLDPRTN